MSKNIFIAWTGLLKSAYILTLVITAFLFYLISTLIPNYKNILSVYNSLGFFKTINFAFLLSANFAQTVKLSSYVSLIVVSLLFGLFVSLVILRTNNIKSTEGKKIGFFATVGIAFGIIAPGCAACGLGVLPLLGISTAFFNFLPLKGLEISIISIGIFSFLIWKISKDLLERNSCDIHSLRENDSFKK